jgi:hypothetical protein
MKIVYYNQYINQIGMILDTRDGMVMVELGNIMVYDLYTFNIEWEVLGWL